MNRPDSFLALIISFCAGIFLASFGVNFWSMLGIGLVVGSLIFWPIISWKLKTVLFLVFCLGFSYFLADDFVVRKNSSAYLNNQGVITAEAIIVDEPEIKNASVWLRVKLIDNNHGKILIKTESQKATLKYGDEILITGKLEEPENEADFDFKNYLTKEVIYSVANYPQIRLLASGQGSFWKAELIAIKKKFISQISRSLPEPGASFLSGLLLGGKSNLPASFKESLNRAGASHLVALSGFNITIVATAVISILLFLGLSRPTSFWLTVFLIVVFVLIVGASASVTRAAIMGILIIMGQKIGRLYYPRNALFLAGLLMILINPKILVFDVGFQLSFLATLGLFYLGPFFQKLLRARQSDFLGWREMLALTLAAQTAVLPLLIFNFSYFSFVAPLSNLLLLSTIPLTMFFGFGGVVFGFIFPLLGQILSLPAFLLLKYEVGVINFLGLFQWLVFLLV